MKLMEILFLKLAELENKNKKKIILLTHEKKSQDFVTFYSLISNYNQYCGDKNYVLNSVKYQPTCYVSDQAPDNGVGSNGDFWFQYS